MTTPLRVSLVNDYEIIVQGLERMLEPFRDRIRVVETEAGGLPCRAADIVLFDTFAGRRHSLRRVEELAADYKLQRLVLYTWDAPSEFLDEVDRSDVDGVILKSQRGIDLVEALERIAAGEALGVDLLREEQDDPDLSEREREVLALIARGRTNPEIAGELYLAVDTVKTHVRTLFRKLGVSNRTQAAIAAGRFALADPSVP